MTNQESIDRLLSLSLWLEKDSELYQAIVMAISALKAQELKQEVKNSGCTYKPDCPWYDGSKCNSPNDHGYHECDYDRGILPEDDGDEMDVSISALQAQEAKVQLSEEGTTSKVKKTCITCKHYPPESKWPCIDCDMRNPADRWEPQELSKNSTELDKENGDLQPTCNRCHKQTGGN